MSAMRPFSAPTNKHGSKMSLSLLFPYSSVSATRVRTYRIEAHQPVELGFKWSVSASPVLAGPCCDS